MAEDDKGKKEPPLGFSVDTHLFRELGELLVGRDSTALVELIKNAYDADATDITVHGSALSDQARGRIVITDNGLGMTEEQFKRGFLRIASRIKEQGDLRSARYKRRFTGAKGVGRLAAHKLAKVLHVDSVATHPRTRKPKERIDATINWPLVESVETLDKIPKGAVTVEQHPVGDSKGGTTITLSDLRRAWSPRDLVRFVTEAQATIPPTILKEKLPATVVNEEMQKLLLFAKPTIESPHTASPEDDPDWNLALTGDFDVGEQYWRALASQATWVIDMDVTPDVARYAIIPTQKLLKRRPEQEAFVSDISLKPEEGSTKPTRESDEEPEVVDTETPAPEPDPMTTIPLSFQARIFVREGTISAGQLPAVRDFIQRTGGIRVYMEGFRVLPYGEQGDDWLRIDKAYTERSRSADPLSATMFAETADENLGLVGIPNRQYFGAVFLTNDGASALRMLVNREGFVPDPGFVKLQDLVIAGIGLATRVRAAASAEEREERRRKRAGKDSATTVDKSATQQIVEAVEEAIEVVADARKALAAGNSVDARTAIDRLDGIFTGASEVGREIVDEQAMIRVLATLGAQTAGFVHEINGLLGLATALDKALNKVRDDLEAIEE